MSPSASTGPTQQTDSIRFSQRLRRDVPCVMRWMGTAVASAAWVTVSPVIGGCAHHETPPAVATAAQQAEMNSVLGVGNFEQVSPMLSRGAQPTAQGFKELEARGVRTVINLRSAHDDQALLAGTRLREVRIPTSPWGIDEQHLRRFLAVVTDPSEGPYFVHCQHGADRTGYVVAGYRVLEQGWSPESAVQELFRHGFHPIWRHIPDKIRGMTPRVAPAASQAALLSDAR